MFENILWAEAVEKTVKKTVVGADKISLASVEAVLKDLDRLANIGMWSIGIILLIAAIAVGYNVWVSERTTRKLRKEFGGLIAKTKHEIDMQISIGQMMTFAAINTVFSSHLRRGGNYARAALFDAKVLHYLIELNKIEKDDMTEKQLYDMTELLLVDLEVCIKKSSIPSIRDIDEIRKSVSKIPKLLLDKVNKIEQLLDKLEKKAKTKGGEKG